MSLNFQSFLTALEAGLAHLPVTLILAIVPLVLGSLFGIFLAVIRYFKIRILSPVIQVTITILKGIPVVLMLLVSYLVVSDYFDKIMVGLNFPWRFKAVNPIFVALFVLTLFAAVQLTELFRGAFNGIPAGQLEAAYSIGLSRRQAVSRILLPQAFKIAIPPLASLFISLIKASALVSMVMVVDVLNGALITATASYSFLEAYLAAGLIYWLLAIAIEQGAKYLEKKRGAFFSVQLQAISKEFYRNCFSNFRKICA